jgi:peptidoglycan-associated lipoprotein
MSKLVKGFFLGLIAVALVLAPACRTKKKPEVVPPQTTSTVPAQTNTDNVPPVVDTTPRVDPNTDFVKTDTEPAVSESTLPADIEQANRLAQERGYIQDAFFGYDDAALSNEAQFALTSSANWMKKNAQYNLLIEGHCDERGTEQYNLALGDRRANIAKEFLATLGVDTGRIRTVSYGEERPFDPGHDEAAMAKNRRAHLVLVGK